MNVEDWYDNWLNGNRKDVVNAIIENGKFSDLLEFITNFSYKEDDRAILIKMLRNRDR